MHNNGPAFVYEHRKFAENIRRDNHVVKKVSSVSSSSKLRLCGIRRLWLISLIMITLFGLLVLTLHYRLFHANNETLLSENTHIRQSANVLQTSNDLLPDVDRGTMAIWEISSESGVIFQVDGEGVVTLPVNTMIWGHYDDAKGIFYASHPVEGSSEFGTFQNLSQSISHFVLDYSKEVAELLAEPDHQITCNLGAALLDADYLGNDIGNTDNVMDASQCCQQCLNRVDCTHWTYVPGSKSCWLKGNTPNDPKIRPGSKLMSGVLNGKRKGSSRGLMSKIQHAAVASLELPSCCGETSDKLEKSSLQGQLLNRKATSPTPWILSRTLTNGDWTEQFPIGNGEIGAFVGGSRDIEVIPLSKAEWFSYHLDALKAKSGQRTEMASKYVEGRQHLAAGKVSDAISALSNVQNTGLGMFEYLSDLVLKLSPLPFEKQSESPPRRLVVGSNRASLQQWFTAAFQQGTSNHIKTLSLLSEHSLDMKTGISVQRDMAVHVKVSNASASMVGESEVLQKSRGFRWTSATYRKWFISAADNVLVGSIKCSASGISGNCLHLALGLLREHSTETGVPTTSYSVVAAGEGVFHIDMTIVSSPALTVPTTHVALNVRCHKGEAFVAGTTTSKDPGFTDSPLAVCNNARQADILLAVETIPTIGRNPEQYDASPSTLQKLKTICWDRIRKAESKGQRQVQADHSADVTASMEQVSVKLSSQSTTELSSACSAAGSAGRMPFPSPFYGDGCVAPSGHYFSEDPRENLLLPQMYTLGRYLMLSSARRHVPNLQGLWAEGVKSEWNGDYHLNINLQMMYWPAASAFPTGKEAQILMPLINFMEELATVGRKTAQDMYTKASESAFFKQHLSEHAWVAHGFTDTTLRGDALADLQWSLCISCGAWAATHIFDVILYGDLATIESSTALKILEIFRGVADFFEAHLFVLPHGQDSQTLYTGPTTSPENSYWTMQQSASDGNGNSNGNGKKSNFFNIDLISSPPPPKPAMGTAYLTFSPAIDVSILREFSNAYYLLATWTSAQVSELNKQHFDYSRQAIAFQQLVSKMTNRGLPQTYTTTAPPLNPREAPGKNPTSGLSTSKATSTAQCHRIREYTWASLPSSQTEGETVTVVENIDVGHRHFSLLHWLYPAQFLPFTNQPNNLQSKTAVSKEDLYSAAKTSLMLKRQHNGGHTSWSAMWEANLWARLGHGEEAFASIKHLVSRYLTSNFLSLHPPLDPHGSKDCVTCFTDEFNHQLGQRKQQLLSQVDHNRQRRLDETDQAMEDPIFHPPPLELPPLPPFGLMAGDAPPVQTGPSVANGVKSHLRGQSPGVGADMRHLQQLSPHTATVEVPDVTRRRGFVTDRGEKFQLDGNLGLVAATHEMLVQSHLPRRLMILPALPTHWKHGGQVVGVGVRGNARVSFSWRNGNLQALVVSFASSQFHPWWSRRIEERPDLPGFYVDEALQSPHKAELTVYSPNRLRVVDKLPQGNGGNLCSVKKFAMNEVCEKCGSMDHLFPSMQTATVRFESTQSSSLPCQLIFCDKSMSIEACQHDVTSVMMK